MLKIDMLSHTVATERSAAFLPVVFYEAIIVMHTPTYNANPQPERRFIDEVIHSDRCFLDLDPFDCPHGPGWI